MFVWVISFSFFLSFRNGNKLKAMPNWGMWAATCVWTAEMPKMVVWLLKSAVLHYHNNGSSHWTCSSKRACTQSTVSFPKPWATFWWLRYWYFIYLSIPSWSGSVRRQLKWTKGKQVNWDPAIVWSNLAAAQLPSSIKAYQFLSSFKLILTHQTINIHRNKRCTV